MSNEQQSVEKQILSALESVRAPSGKTLVESGILTGLEGEHGQLTLRCQHPGWPTPIRQRVEREIVAAVRDKLPQLSGVHVDWREMGDPSMTTTPPARSMPGVPDSFQVRNVVAVGSGKGGVGKSTIAAAIAYSLRHRGASVGLMDADVYGPTIPHLLGLHGQPAIANQMYEPHAVDGIKCMSMGFLVPANQSVIWRGPMLHKAVRDFLFVVNWGPLDYLIVDLPPGTGDIVLSLSQQMPLSGGVIVCTPQDVALLDARKALDMFRTVKIPCRGVVENMSFFNCPSCGARSEIFGHGGARNWARNEGVPFLGEVPINLVIRTSGDSGALRDCFADASPVKDCLMAIADALVEQVRGQPVAAGPTLDIVG